MSETDKNRILVVEDEDNLRELVRCRLEANGYEVAVAENGYKALVAVRDFRPNLVILDLMLPKMDGYSVCRMLKSGGGEQTVPIILFTARSSDDDRQHGLDMGADAYVSKPFDPPVLLGTIDELLNPEKYAEAKEAEAKARAEKELKKLEEEERRLAEKRAGLDAEAKARADAEASSPEDVAETPQDAPEPAPPETEPEAESPSDEQLSPDEQAARVSPPAPESEEMDDKSEAQPGFFARLFRRLFKPAPKD